jgi:hypothetical protein
MKLEQFEKEFQAEIKQLKSLRFEPEPTPTFKFPTYQFIYTKALSLAFAVPALVIAFGFFFYGQEQSVNNQNLAVIEASNARILNQINTLDNENNI